MQTKARCAVALLLIATAVSCGSSGQKALANRLREADRGIVMDRADSSFSMPVNREDIRKLVQAISTARKESPLIQASVRLRIEFFKGTNLLGAIDVCPTGSPNKVGIFGVDGVPYSERTGTLETLAARFSQERAARNGTKRLTH